MAHYLLRKKALDAVNEALLQPSDSPDDRKYYNSPFAAKGTEFSPTKMGQRKRAAREYLHLSRRMAALLSRTDSRDLQAFVAREVKTAAEGVDYQKLAAAIAGTIDLLNRVAPKGSNLQIWAETNAPDLWQFIKEDQRKARRQAARLPGSGKRAEIQMHNDPKLMAPRQDMRSRVDEDVKKERENDPDLSKDASSRSRLLRRSRP